MAVIRFQRVLRGAPVGVVLAFLSVAAGCGRTPAEDPPPAEPGNRAAQQAELGVPGGRVVSALRAEPSTFNPVLPMNNPGRTLIGRIHADLVHINRGSQRTEPALAESWQVSDDGLRYILNLRPNVRFSDGEPFDADDVVFTYRAILDEAIGAPNRNLLLVEGRPIEIAKVDELTVEFTLAAPYAVGERMFDTIPILPEHRLRSAWEEGRLTQVWGLDTPADEIVGLGPFRLRSYSPGDRVVLERNPHYWRRDRAGNPLPYLDELVLLFIGSEDAQALRLQSGELDLSDRLKARNFQALREAGDGGLSLRDLGPSLSYEFLFFNLNQLSDRPLPKVAAKQAWFRDMRFRRAISAAIDRRAIVRLVFQGAATPLASHVTPSNRLWHNQQLAAPERSLERARQELADAGYRWNDRGALLDAAGRAVEFHLITNASNTQRVEMATLIQEDLRELGIAVQVVPLEFRLVVERVTRTLDYEACLLGLGGGDVDPNSYLPVFLSDGATHLWDMADERARPDWQREMDDLLRRQVSMLDPDERRRAYDRVQEILAEHLPLIYLVSPNVLVAADADLGNFRPAVMRHSTLWNAEELFWRSRKATGED